MIFKILFLVLSLNNITFKVDGLTCSMCSLNVQKQLEKVYFIENVESNIEEVTYEIQLKKNHYIDFYAIEYAIVDAGFSINKESVVIDTKNTNDFWQNSNYIIWKNK
jgi:copper chaperone CopZ|tara:strand:- start:604 stop:924 length:321 start_codon:yes stop_codon:yes gene_type:complete